MHTAMCTHAQTQVPALLLFNISGSLHSGLDLTLAFFFTFQIYIFTYTYTYIDDIFLIFFPSASHTR